MYFSTFCYNRLIYVSCIITVHLLSLSPGCLWLDTLITIAWRGRQGCYLPRLIGPDRCRQRTCVTTHSITGDTCSAPSSWHAQTCTARVDVSRVLSYILSLKYILRKILQVSCWGTALQAGRSWVRFPMVSLENFIDIILPVTVWPWDWFSLWQKWVPEIFPGW